MRALPLCRRFARRNDRIAEVKNEITRSVVITITIAAILLCRRRLPGKQQ
jgi:hypothetical protein